MRAFTTGPFTGRHIAAILLGAFAVVLGVNVLMARDAISSFSGEVVENSYVASQHYNEWLHEAAQEKALGWSAVALRRGDGHVRITLAGAPASGVTLAAVARRPLGAGTDQALAFARDAGEFVSNAALPAGRWTLRIEATAGTGAGTHRWRSEVPLQ